MVTNKKAHCAYCVQKCSGSVLRYQDQYYHKPCFGLLQSELAAAQASGDSASESWTNGHYGSGLTRARSAGNSGSQLGAASSALGQVAPSDRSRCSSRSQLQQPRGVYSVLGSIGRSRPSSRARSPSMMNEEPIQLAAYPSGRRPSPDSVPKIERDDFPAPPFPYTTSSSGRHHHHQHHHHRSHSALRSSNLNEKNNNEEPSIESRHHNGNNNQERASRPRSRDFSSRGTGILTPSNRGYNNNRTSISSNEENDLLTIDADEEDDEDDADPRLRREEEELSKIANGIGKIFLQTLKEREKLRAWKRVHLDPRNASRTPSATRELLTRPLRYDNPTNASPSRDINRPRPWIGPGEDRASELSAMPSSLIHQRAKSSPPSRQVFASKQTLPHQYQQHAPASKLDAPKMYPYHMLVTTNYRLPPDVDRCHLERHLSREEFQYIFHCDRLDFYRLPEWRRNELKRCAKLF